MPIRVNVIDTAGLHRLESLNISKGFEFNYSLRPERADFNVYIGVPELLHQPYGDTRNIFLITEPPEIVRYDLIKLKQFDLVVGPKFDYLEDLPIIFDSHPLLPAFVGFQFPLGSKRFFKSKTLQYKRPSAHKTVSQRESISVIMSGKRITEMHRLRLDFVNFMLKNSNLPLELYGKNFTPLSDKYELLSSCKFHLAFENSIHHNYLTEKIHDPIISSNHVFYVGAPNIHDYYSTDRVSILNPHNFHESMNLISTIFHSTKDVNAFRNKDSLKYFESYSLEASLSKILSNV